MHTMTTRANNQTAVCLSARWLWRLLAPQLHIPVCTLNMQNSSMADFPSQTNRSQILISRDTLVTEYPPLSSQTHPDADSLILSHPLITHTDALERQDRKALCMQNRQAEHTQGSEGKKEPDREGRGVFVCDVRAFSGLWIFTKALLNCPPILPHDLIPARSARNKAAC